MLSGRAKGLQVVARDVPAQIVIEADYTLTMAFTFSAEARKVAAQIALAAIAFEYGIPFALSPCFDVIRKAYKTTGDRDLRVWIFANEGLMSAHLRTAHQHSVMCYLSAGMKKAGPWSHFSGVLPIWLNSRLATLHQTARCSAFFMMLLRRRGYRRSCSPMR